MLFAKGAPTYKPVEELNLSLAPLVRDVHREYLAQGARILRTNTFGGNRIRLALAGLEGKLAAINGAGRAHRAGGRPGSGIRSGRDRDRRVFGWLHWAVCPMRRLAKCSGSRLAALEGVDLFVLETFRSVAEVRAAVEGIREAAGDEIVVVAHVTVQDDACLEDGTPPERFGPALPSLSIDAIGVNCSSGPHAVAAAIERLRKENRQAAQAPSPLRDIRSMFSRILRAARGGKWARPSRVDVAGLRRDTCERWARCRERCGPADALRV